ncbi:MAG: hypothetical protein RLZZ618_3350 [Pseudomonadota bacterium]|jgi:regulator of nucleoside diphosphate kinase
MSRFSSRVSSHIAAVLSSDSPSRSTQAAAPQRTVTKLDFVRLSRLESGHTAPLQEVLEATDIVRSEDIAPNVVTMASQVDLVDDTTGESQRLTLCYPSQADASEGRVSVLSPVGTSVLGLSAGDTATWRTPHGEKRRATLAAVVFQPEAGGDYLS